MHILVTGATGGIGQGICEVLASQAKQELKLTVASTQNGERLSHLLQALRDMGVQAQGVEGSARVMAAYGTGSVAEAAAFCPTKPVLAAHPDAPSMLDAVLAQLHAP